jgi:aspartyl-tRNA(Asn)/glutamyl-tRNA(Gln) amidotransferase subunit A
VAELTTRTIAELRDGFRAGDFSAREIAESYNAAVAAAKSLNAYTVETPNDALAAAEVADRTRGQGCSLAGIPLGIKDLFATKGVDTTARQSYPAGLQADLRKHRHCQPAQGRRRHARASSTWTSSRWARPTRPATTAR